MFIEFDKNIMLEQEEQEVETQQRVQNLKQITSKTVKYIFVKHIFCDFFVLIF